MFDLIKAQFQMDKKMLDRKFNENLKDLKQSLKDLNNYKDSQENASVAGSTKNFDGSVNIQEKLNVNGELKANSIKALNLLTTNGEKVATQNWVNANMVQGDSNVEVTKTYRFEGDGDTNTFEFSFIGDSVSIFKNGVKLDSTDYTLNYDDNNKGKSVTLNKTPSDKDVINSVAFGGADIYTKTQSDAQFMSREELKETYISKDEQKEANVDNSPVLLSSVCDFQGDWVNYDDEGTTGWNAVITKTADGYVHISGIVTGDTNDVRIAENLLEKYRPTKKVMAIQNSQGTSGGSRIDVHPDGKIIIEKAGTSRADDSTNWISVNFVYYAGN